MQDEQLINLWKSYSQKLDQSLVLNQKNTEDITKIKVISLLGSMKPLKFFTIAVGILWVIFVDTILINTFNSASWFFLISAGIQVVLTKLAIGIYLYQMILIRQVDISEPILKTQTTLARLTASTLWVTRLLFLQLPVWTTFYLNVGLFKSGSIVFYTIQTVVTLAFTLAAVWLFKNINDKNLDKKWFRHIFNGKEWDPVIESMELLNQIKTYEAA